MHSTIFGVVLSWSPGHAYAKMVRHFTVQLLLKVNFKNCYCRSGQYIFPHYFFLETNNFQIQKFIYKSKTMLNISRYAYLCIQTQNLEVSGQNLDVLGY